MPEIGRHEAEWAPYIISCLLYSNTRRTAMIIIRHFISHATASAVSTTPYHFQNYAHGLHQLHLSKYITKAHARRRVTT